MSYEYVLDSDLAFLELEDDKVKNVDFTPKTITDVKKEKKSEQILDFNEAEKIVQVKKQQPLSEINVSEKKSNTIKSSKNKSLNDLGESLKFILESEDIKRLIYENDANQEVKAPSEVDILESQKFSLIEKDEIIRSLIENWNLKEEENQPEVKIDFLLKKEKVIKIILDNWKFD